MAFVINELVPPNIAGAISIAMEGQTDAAIRAMEGTSSQLFALSQSIAQLSERINRVRQGWHRDYIPIPAARGTVLVQMSLAHFEYRLI